MATINLQIQSDIRSAIQIASFTIRSLRYGFIPRRGVSPRTRINPYQISPFRLRAFSTGEPSYTAVKSQEKPSICTADELHFVSVENSDWRVALWRYNPPSQAPKRNHPLLLLSGVGTNAIGYDLSPGSSFARYMSGQGFDTWILEVRGAGLSVQGSSLKDIERSAHAVSDQMEAAANTATNEALSTEHQLMNAHTALPHTEVSDVKEDRLLGIATVWDESDTASKLTETFMSLSERLSGFLNDSQSMIMSAKLFDQISKLLEDSRLSERFNEIREKLLTLLQTRQNSGIASQISDLSQRLVNIIEEGQQSVSPQLFDLQERLSLTIGDFQQQLDLIVKYNWDFDHYLEEDVPAAMEYIRAQTKPNDGKLLAIGHSMGGILLYSLLSRCAYEGKESQLAAVVTLASSLDYTTSQSTLKLLLPLANPTEALNVPFVPLGALLAAAYPLSSQSPYALSWLTDLISAEDMMQPELLKKLVLNNFCTIPAKLLLQLRTAFREGGLCDRSGKFFYKDHLPKTNVPVLALAGDRDLICPPVAVEETAKLFPENLVTYKVFGKAGGPHYAHYDLVGGRQAVEEVYPCIVHFLDHYDSR